MPGKKKSRAYRIAAIPGDGTGPEVIREGIKVLNAAAGQFGLKLDFTTYDLGGDRYLKTGEILPDAVFNELKARGHDVSRLRPYGMSGCATTVMIDPATGNRFAAADPRRDCYAIAY